MSDSSRRNVVAPPALVIEKDFFLVGELCALLEELGLDVRVFPDAHQALESARERRFCLAILGAKAPGDPDVRLAAQLKAVHPDIPLVLLCAPAAVNKLSDPGALAQAIHVELPVKVAAIRKTVMDSLGIADSDKSGTTIPR
jgi:DNA-binding NtrC family response regulator